MFGKKSREGSGFGFPPMESPLSARERKVEGGAADIWGPRVREGEGARVSCPTGPPLMGQGGGVSRPERGWAEW